MTNLEQQLRFISTELDKYRVAYDISVQKVNSGDKSAIVVLELITNCLQQLSSIKVSLETLQQLNS